MEVILLQKIGKLGNLGDKVAVKPGYARNYLLPQGKATLATAAKLAEFEQRRVELEKLALEGLSAAQARAAAIGQLNITIAQKAGEEGKLFGSVGVKDIVDAMNNAGIAINKQDVRLPNGQAIRQVGDYEIQIHLHTDVNATLALKVAAE
ncbi:MAG TPA: 50S ribosomal protein L9 [Methylococcaceae bacterium]|nr:50S ribosomal protein L9 [Methylococcaceae bacterium]